MTIADEITGYMKKVEDIHKDIADDGHALNAYMLELTSIMARVNYLMATSKRLLRQEKKRGYNELLEKAILENKTFSPAIAKDYIENASADFSYQYDLAERCSRLCVHTINAIRTIISALKAERQYMPHQ